MNRIIALWMIGSLLSAHSVLAACMVGFGASASITCSGSFESGQYESFEKASGEVCTTGWTEADTGGVISLYSTGASHCGTHSMEIVGDSDTVGASTMDAVLSSADGTFSFRAYFYVPVDYDNYSTFDFFKLIDGTSNPRLTLTTNKTATYTKIYSSASAQYFQISSGSWYYFVIEWNSSGTSYLKLFNSSGIPIESSVGGDYSIDITSAYSIKTFRFTDAYSLSTAKSLYIDDVIYSSSAADLTGAQTCN